MADQLVNYYRIEKAIGYLTANFKAQPDLEAIAAKVHMSPYHFQRIFTDWVGISPKKFVQYLTLDYLKQKIRSTENMIEAADEAGLSSQSRVHELFVKIEGVSPQQYKSGGAGLDIAYGYHASPFGLCFIAIAEQSICALKFIDEEQSRNEFAVFIQQWPKATLIHDPAKTQPFVQNIFKAPPCAPDHPEDPGKPSQLQLLVKGTEFQLKVWEALVHIPFGSVATFNQIARLIGQPDAARAVGGAIKANSILYLIPCHRIITKEGNMGNYHYGRVRKMAMIGWENTKL
ncbi:MAG TPA: methylated-DNA--[protein]-cysteine S-methyltransferase [Puia sp.]|jgi:AraC family transcriptional regulator of adaptative response/methylated-DNA-[protein]-cysteine methyltransferase|nr:methylated-DNA--[protein]-cysteine S-methyltransferase [Puia sp.]